MLIAFVLAAAIAAFGVDPLASQPFAPTSPDHAPGSCHVRRALNGMQLPDPTCTPGAVNPTVTADVLRNPAFRTGTVRDKATSAAQKRHVYAWYGIAPPLHNTGPNQVCELDHLISLGIGGADTLDNLWPQCGPAGVPVGQREFKVKDAHAELGLMRDIKAGSDLVDIQRLIAADWTQFIVDHGPANAALSPADQLTLPPSYYRRPLDGSDLSVTMKFVSAVDLSKWCHQPPGSAGACTLRDRKGHVTIVAPNPCASSADYAILLCHEIGHANGWGGQHPDYVAASDFPRPLTMRGLPGVAWRLNTPLRSSSNWCAIDASGSCLDHGLGPLDLRDGAVESFPH